MATQTQTIKERLQFICDELKYAAEKHGEVAKEHVRAAVEHAQATRTEIEAKLKEEHAKNKVQLETTVEHLQEVTRQAKAAMDAKGTQFEDYVKKSMIAVKAALEENVSRN